MDDFINLARWLITIGLTLLLILLRLDAEKFGTAEYYESTRDGERPRVRRRLGWYGLGFAIAIAILYIHPSPQVDLFLGSGNRLGAVLGGLAYGLIGIVVAVSFATYRYHRIRFPDSWSYPGALLNSTATAFIDEAAFRGALFGLLLVAGVNPTLANFTQAIIYTLTTRLGAPGRDRYLLVLTMGMGLIGGWLTVVTGGIAAAFVGHAITRFAVFLCTGHTGQTKPRGREVEEIEKRRRPPEGWRVIGSRESASRDR
ncbi:MAG TPA: CPBP family intramembrane glutamic endopeptidase [Candidatus Limnocylindrales bacterium]|nr:CPBP family intramembrane glutamic endopeptidase [Candidatus Limnocylindrales bacterium]